MRHKITMICAVVAGLIVMAAPDQAQDKSSMEDAVRQVVSALASNDQAALDKLSIDQAEFKKYVWPTIASRVSGSNTNAEKYFTTYRRTSQVGVTEASAALAGRKWEERPSLLASRTKNIGSSCRLTSLYATALARKKPSNSWAVYWRGAVCIKSRPTTSVLRRGSDPSGNGSAR